MNTEDIEALLTGAEETDALEFKGAVSWDRNLFVKDILAMANVIDGGRIVVGVEDGTFVRIGLSAEQVASFKIDDMRDGIAPFADPRAVFRMETVVDAARLRFVVIEVSPFEDVPLICKRDGADVRAGVVYLRSRTRRPESAAVACAGSASSRNCNRGPTMMRNWEGSDEGWASQADLRAGPLAGRIPIARTLV